MLQSVPYRFCKLVESINISPFGRVWLLADFESTKIPLHQVHDLTTFSLFYGVKIKVIVYTTQNKGNFWTTKLKLNKYHEIHYFLSFS